MDLLESCELCYPFTLSELPDKIIIEGGLDHTKDYYFKVTDKFPNSFVTDLITPDVSGNVTIQVNTVGLDVTSFITPLPPQAWLNKNAGKFYIEASLTKDKWTPENFTFDGKHYQCLVVEFVYDTSDLITIK